MTNCATAAGISAVALTISRLAYQFTTDGGVNSCANGTPRHAAKRMRAALPSLLAGVGSELALLYLLSYVATNDTQRLRSNARNAQA